MDKIDKIRLDVDTSALLESNLPSYSFESWAQSSQLVQLYLINLLWFQKRSY